MMAKHDDTFVYLAMLGIFALYIYNYYVSLSDFEVALYFAILVSSGLILILLWVHFFSKHGRERRTRIETIRSLPKSLISQSNKSVKMGIDKDLGINVYLPDNIRSRHVHILGATGSGKTESVILNFLKQDVSRGLGAIIMDAKGDASFLDELKENVPEDKLLVFDLSSAESLGYDPLESGGPMESAQRLFSSLQWSEEYYKSKALAALQSIYQYHFELEKKNPQLTDIAHYLEDPKRYALIAGKKDNKESIKAFEKEFSGVLGLRDQVNSLCIGYLGQTLSPITDKKLNLSEASDGKVLYFRLQSLMSPQLVGIVGRLIINNLNYLAGTAHRGETQGSKTRFIPTYLDEFASFACQEFADLISKARSAGLALHFSHQSIGDLSEVSQGFINKITDNSATKIVLRINDPDSAEYMARSFGTKIYQKITQRVTNSEEADLAKSIGEGSVREAHQYRAPPDLLKTLPTGMGSVLVAHGENANECGSVVFKIKFPKLKKEKLDVKNT